MKSIFPISLASLLALTSLHAAKAPRDEMELKAEAAHIVNGTVLKVDSVVADSTVETGFGNHTDKTYTIRIRVTAVTKGEGIEEGDVITISAWQPERRFPPVPGLQGHEQIPTKGNRVTLFLKAARDDDHYEPILPNGIRILD